MPRTVQSRFEYVREWEATTEQILLPESFLVVRVDGKNFHTFAERHSFWKPNDKRALDLMMSAARSVMREFAPHITLAYGQSDEFSFVLRRNSELFSRRANKIMTTLATHFAAAYVFHWRDHFGGSVSVPLRYPPTFDSRCVMYPREELVKDYLRWRQVDCHVNNLYNTTYHALTGEYTQYEFFHDNDDGGDGPPRQQVLPNEQDPCQRRPSSPSLLSATESAREEFNQANSIGGGKSNYRVIQFEEFIGRRLSSGTIERLPTRLTGPQATHRLTGTVKGDKNEILFEEFGINYNNEPVQFKKGSLLVLRLLNNDDNNDRDVARLSSTSRSQGFNISSFPPHKAKRPNHKNHKNQKSQIAGPPNLHCQIDLIHDNLIDETFWENNPNLLL